MAMIGPVGFLFLSDWIHVFGDSNGALYVHLRRGSLRGSNYTPAPGQKRFLRFGVRFLGKSDAACGILVGVVGKCGDKQGVLTPLPSREGVKGMTE